MRILVTEDEKDLADALAKGLEHQGYAVDVAYDGDESLRLAEVNDYDLLILDLNLPKVDGIGVCKRLRDSGSSVGILMLTARAGLDSRVEGLDTGADDYLVKPFHFPELLARVRSILRREGEQQRVAIARALANDPSIILGDEPTGNLDSKTGKRIVEIPHSLTKDGKTVVVATHASEIATRADMVMEMEDGKVTVSSVFS